MTTTLSEAVLVAGVDDWVPLVAVDGLARLGDPSAPDAEIRPRIVSAIRELATHELVQVGDVGEGGFRSWEGSPAAWLDRIEHIYASKTPDARSFAAWLNNTEAGDEVGRRVLASRESR